MKIWLRGVSLVFAILIFHSAWLGFANKPLMFLNLPSFLLAIAVPFLIMVGWHGRAAVTFYKLKGRAKNAIIDLWSRMLMAAGVTGSIIGIVDMLANMKDPRAIGPGLAVALLTILYAFTAKLFLLEPFRDISSSGENV